MAAPQPNVLNLTSVITPSSIFRYIFMMSPHVGLPTSPTPSAFSISPTLRGFAKWSITFALYIHPSILLSKFKSLWKVMRAFSPAAALPRLFDLVPHRARGPRRARPPRSASHTAFGVLHRVLHAEADAQAAVSDLVGQADGKQHVAGVQAAGGACRAGGGTDAVHVQHEQQALALGRVKLAFTLLGRRLLPSNGPFTLPWASSGHGPAHSRASGQAVRAFRQGCSLRASSAVAKPTMPARFSVPARRPRSCAPPSRNSAASRRGGYTARPRPSVR